MPAPTFSSASISRCERTSSSRSASTRLPSTKFRRKLRTFTNSGMEHSLRRLQSLRDGQRNTAPPLGFRLKLFSSRLGQTVVFRAAIVFGLTPERRNPALFFHAVQGREQRAGFHVKGPAGDLLHSTRNSQTMQFTSNQRFQDQQVQ